MVENQGPLRVVGILTIVEIAGPGSNMSEEGEVVEK